MKLTDHQCQILNEVFGTSDAIGYTETLMDIYEGFLLSSNDEQGRMCQDYTTNCFHLMKQVCRLLLAIEPKAGFQGRREDVC